MVRVRRLPPRSGNLRSDAAHERIGRKVLSQDRIIALCTVRCGLIPARAGCRSTSQKESAVKVPHHGFVSVLAALATLAFSTIASAAGNPSADQVLINAKSVKWVAAPPVLPKGAMVAVLHGDPNTDGQYVMRVMLPPRYKMPFHWHTKTQHVTVIYGALFVRSHDTHDNSIATTLQERG